jgi:hypothetical protein
MNQKMQALWPSIAFLFLGLAAGFLLDFLFNAVLKIVWVAIYLPCYCAIGGTFWNAMLESRWVSCRNVALLGFTAGCLGAHLLLNGRVTTQIYSLTLVSETPPMALRSRLWPETLYVYGDKVGGVLRDWSNKNDVPLTTVIVTDYGCTKSTRMVMLAGFNIEADAGTNWVWKDDDRLHKPPKIGPGSEDRRFPWCLIKFYRGTS